MAACEGKKPVEHASEKVKKSFLEHYQNLRRLTDELEDKAVGEVDEEALRELFKKARLEFKKVEPILAFYYPEYSKKLNGPAIDKNDYHDVNRKVLAASGFQVVEEGLFTQSIQEESLKKEIGVLGGLVRALEPELQLMVLSDSNIFEALRLEMLRMISLGITGFDSPVLLYSLPEAIATLEGLEQYLTAYITDEGEMEIFEEAIDYLSENANDFNGFDRAHFIREYGRPINELMYRIQRQNGISNNKLQGALDMDKADFLEQGAFRKAYFAPSDNGEVSDDQIRLGEQLFFDPILSGNGKISCASCHIPDQAYADHLKTAIEGKGAKSRNTPTLLNAAYQNAIFLDGRVAFLEDQAKKVINNKDEMHGSFENALRKVGNSADYQKEFDQVFGEGVSERNLLKAIGSYVRSLSPLNSRFDGFLRGEEKLSEEEILGFNTYMGKAKCATCHFFPLFNGAVPPLYNETESEVLGVPVKPDTLNAEIDEDLGEYHTLGAELKRFAFKTPTVRNAARTWPYMHNGVYKTLEEVIDFYDRGGGAGIGIDLPHQTLPPDKLDLSDEEKIALVAFIKTLNDRIPENSYQEKSHVGAR